MNFSARQQVSRVYIAHASAAPNTIVSNLDTPLLDDTSSGDPAPRTAKKEECTI
jgi:hypothetical protein